MNFLFVFSIYVLINKMKYKIINYRENSDEKLFIGTVSMGASHNRSSFRPKKLGFMKAWVKPNFFKTDAKNKTDLVIWRKLMKAVAFNGSPKTKGNTAYALSLVTEELKKEGVEVEIIDIGSEPIKGCTSCYHCAKNKTGECINKTDRVNEYIEKMKEADGIIYAAPTYVASIPGTMKNFIDRATVVLTYSYDVPPLRHKVGTGIATARRSGESAALDTLNNALSFNEMIIPTSNYWNLIYGNTPGDAEKDEEGKQTMRVLGKNIAYLLKIKEAAKHIKAPEHEEKIKTNYR